MRACVSDPCPTAPHRFLPLPVACFLPAAPAAAASCDLLLKLFPLRQPLLSRHATDVLTALCAAPGARLSASALSELLAAALGSEQLWEKRDPDATLAAIKLLEDGLCRLAALDPVVVSKRLPRAVHTLVPQLASDHEGVRIAAAGCLKNVINECVDEQAVRAALAGTSTGKQPPPLLSVLAALEASLGAHYQDAWGACLPGAWLGGAWAGGGLTKWRHARDRQ